MIYKLLIILVLTTPLLTHADQMYIHIKTGNLSHCNDVLKNITKECTGQEAYADFLIGKRRTGYVNGKTIRNNTRGYINTLLGCAFEVDREIVQEWGDVIITFIQTHPSKVVGIEWLSISDLKEVLPGGFSE